MRQTGVTTCLRVKMLIICYVPLLANDGCAMLSDDKKVQ